MKKYKNIIKLIIFISIIYTIYYYNQQNNETFSNTDDNVKPYDPDSFNEFEPITPSSQIVKSNQDKTLDDCLPPPKKLQPKFVYSSIYDDLVSGDSKVIFSGLKSELLDATHTPRVISKYVYPYIPHNYDILLNNPNDKPWNRHPISSIRRDLKPKYDNVFYFELDNDVYMNSFKQTFHFPCDIDNRFSSSNWSTIYEVNDDNTYIINAYNAFISYINDELNTSKNMILKEDPNNKKPIQIVHDILQNYRVHKKYKNIILLHIELLLYRESKYNGKHIGIKCVIINTKNNKVIFSSNTNSSPSSSPSANINSQSTVSIQTNKDSFILTNGVNLSKNGEWIFYMIEAELIGDVPEDMIAIYPITPISKTFKPQIKLDDTNDLSLKYAGILPTTANGKVYTGFGDTNIPTSTLEIEKQHIKNHINFSQKNIDYTSEISQMTPEEAVTILNIVNAELRHDVLSTLPAEHAAKILLLMTPEVQKQALFEMDKQAALNALYLINNPNKIGM